MNNKKPFISIMEQPTSSMKFRYRCERRNNVIYGMNSTTATKTYPTIIINNCNGYQNGVLYISCVSEKETGGKYHMHPHKILKKDSAENCIGFRILKFTMNDNDNNFIFIECKNLCIEYTKKHDVEKVLESYERLKFDPFKAGFEHKDLSSKSIDPSSVRICFQAILTNTDEKKSIVLDPVVSTVIKNYVGKYKLKIYRLSRHSALATGGTELTLLCNKVSKNIRVLFYQKDNDDNIIWQRYAYIIDVYRQVAITIKTPEYNGLQFGIIKVFIQLVRKTDGVTSEPHKFELISNNLPCYKNKKPFLKGKLEFFEKLGLFKKLLQNKKNSRLCGENNFGAIDLSITSKSHPRAVSLVSAASTQHGSNNRTNLKENETVTSGFYKVPSPNYGQHQLRHQQFVQQRQYGQLNFPSHHQQIINHHNLRMIQQNKNYTAQNVGEHNQQEFVQTNLSNKDENTETADELKKIMKFLVNEIKNDDFVQPNTHNYNVEQATQSTSSCRPSTSRVDTYYLNFLKFLAAIKIL
ncbi:hypothetical protein HCN44_003061 [Aphidius gifuensis]|uniref:RHD domain-containing protein n=1 Tax=Aphidius gifuensis TaxID=684658 RepID=A0A835CJW8_APHGI|nr:hypothetical protein HCN44_003061 [Aphidius gifuensis]